MHVSRIVRLDLDAFARRFNCEIVPYLSSEEVHLRLGRQEVLSQLERLAEDHGVEGDLEAEFERIGAV